MANDITILKAGQSLPKTWTCPFCKKKNKMDIWAPAIFNESGLVLRTCDHCCAVHGWEKERVEKALQELEQEEEQND